MTLNEHVIISPPLQAIDSGNKNHTQAPINRINLQIHYQALNK